MTTWLRGEVQKSFAPPWDAVSERLIFGALDADQIVDHLSAACGETFGAGLHDGFLYQVSAGIVIGCDLTDGRRVVLKAYQPRWSPAFLDAVKRTQAHLHHNGFPCPEPLDSRVVLGQAELLAEAVLPDPGIGLPDPSSRSALAAGLADQIDRCRQLNEPALGDHPLRRPHDGPFPEPHSPIFDFPATRAGAEWIEDLARRGRDLIELDDSPPVIAHTDWSMRNIRVEQGKVVAAYDWDSLALVREAEAVALAATTWSKTGEPGEPTPSLEDMDRYVVDYESRRGTPFTPTQHKAIRGAVVAAMAYTARCEHALDPTEQRASIRPRLREAAAHLL